MERESTKGFNNWSYRRPYNTSSYIPKIKKKLKKM